MSLSSEWTYVVVFNGWQRIAMIDALENYKTRSDEMRPQDAKSLHLIEERTIDRVGDRLVDDAILLTPEHEPMPTALPAESYAPEEMVRLYGEAVRYRRYWSAQLTEEEMMALDAALSRYHDQSDSERARTYVEQIRRQTWARPPEAGT